jgi:hypothetical protein
MRMASRNSDLSKSLLSLSLLFYHRNFIPSTKTSLNFHTLFFSVAVRIKVATNISTHNCLNAGSFLVLVDKPEFIFLMRLL